MYHQCRECGAVSQVEYGHEAYAICLVSGNRIMLNSAACPSFKVAKHIGWSSTVEKEAKNVLREL